MTPDKQAAPSEWVERGVELADEAARWAYKAGDHGDRALLVRRDAELAALRAHLEAKELEHQSDREVTVKVCNEMGALQALVEQMAFELKATIPYLMGHRFNQAIAALAAWQQHVALQEKT